MLRRIAIVITCFLLFTSMTLWVKPRTFPLWVDFVLMIVNPSLAFILVVIVRRLLHERQP